jgi:hypothetical protein
MKYIIQVGQSMLVKSVINQLFVFDWDAAAKKISEEGRERYLTPPAKFNIFSAVTKCSSLQKVDNCKCSTFFFHLLRDIPAPAMLCGTE